MKLLLVHVRSYDGDDDDDDDHDIGDDDNVDDDDDRRVNGAQVCLTGRTFKSPQVSRSSVTLATLSHTGNTTKSQTGNTKSLPRVTSAT